jgi:hypothetical protein
MLCLILVVLMNSMMQELKTVHLFSEDQYVKMAPGYPFSDQVH